MALRGVSCAVGGEWVVRSAGVRRGCVGERKCSGRACRCAWASGGLRREWVVRSAGNASRSLRVCVGAAWGSGSTREGRVAVRGWAKVFGGKWVVRSAGLTHFRRSSSRARVLLYIRPPVHVVKSQPWDRKGVPAFTLPRIAFRGPRRAIGLPQQQLSTMGYPRKSYPHRCSPPCAKRSRPRACARVYNISFARRLLPGSVRAAPEKSPRRCVTVSRTAVRRVGEGKAKADAPSRSAPHFPRLRPRPCQLMGEVPSAKAEVHKVIPAPARAYSPRQLVYGRAPARLCPNHCAQRRKCTRQSSPLPVRTPRDSLPTAAPPPLVCRIAERKGGVHKAIPAPARASFPRELVYGRALCPLMGEVPSAGWGRAKAKADAPSRSAPYLPAYRPAPAA